MMTYYTNDVSWQPYFLGFVEVVARLSCMIMLSVFRGMGGPLTDIYVVTAAC